MVLPVRTLVADPPWRFRDRLPGPGRGAAKKYSCMDLDDIKAYLDEPLELPRYGRVTVREILADDAVLFMWRVSAMKQAALDVVEAWGFPAPEQEVVWVKVTKGAARRLAGDRKAVPAEGGLRMVMGHFLRSCHETAEVSRRGRRKAAPRDKGVLDTILAPIGEHSEKPDAFYELVERVADGPYLELFARRRRYGWVQHGLELEGEATG